jgi:hypothetical protein
VQVSSVAMRAPDAARRAPAHVAPLTKPNLTLESWPRVAESGRNELTPGLRLRGPLSQGPLGATVLISITVFNPES